MHFKIHENPLSAGGEAAESIRNDLSVRSSQLGLLYGADMPAFAFCGHALQRLRGAALSQTYPRGEHLQDRGRRYPCPGQGRGWEL
jgi:hypothetical protein